MLQHPRKHAILLVASLAALLLYGCSAPTGPERAPGTIIKSHMVQNGELRAMMRELDTVLNDDPKSELERDDARRRYALRAADTIGAIAVKIKRLPETHPLFDEKGEEEQFLRYTEALGAEGERLRMLALAYEVEHIAPQMARVERVCNACHTHFRDLSTDLKRGE